MTMIVYPVIMGGTGSGGGSSTINDTLTMRTVTTNTTVLNTDEFINCDCTSGNIIITVPTLSALLSLPNLVVQIKIEKVDPTANKVQINLSGGDVFLDGSTIYFMPNTQGSVVQLIGGNFAINGVTKNYWTQH